MTRRLEVLVVIAAATLTFATWPLWRGGTPFPQVPLFAFATGAPRWIDTAALVVAAGGLLMVMVGLARGAPASSPVSRDGVPRGDSWRVAGWCEFLVAVVVLVCLSQQRWQPWVWQFWILGGLFAVAPRNGVPRGDAQRGNVPRGDVQCGDVQCGDVPRGDVQCDDVQCDDVCRLARLVVIGLYLHSAVSKLDASFLQTHGPQLVDGLLANLGAALPARGAMRTIAAAALPIGELACAGLLLFRPARRVGLVASIAMHLALMAALGPWGLDHRPGVLLWNLYFVAQNLILFRGGDSPVDDPRDGDSRHGSPHDQPAVEQASVARVTSVRTDADRVIARRAVPFVLLATVLPFAGWFERVDPWLGWGLYSSRPARVKFFVDESAVERLPLDLQPFVEPAAPLERWRRVRLDRWSLETLGAPLSPQPRVHVGAALGIVREARLQDDCLLVEESPAARWTGRRTSRQAEGAAAIEARADDFHANARPRRDAAR